MIGRAKAGFGPVVLVLLLAVPCAAHQAVAIGGVYDDPAVAVEIFDPEVSQVVYGDLPVGRASLWMAVEVPAAMDIYVQIGVPYIDRLRAYRPQLALLGPGLPSLDLPIPVPAGLGGMLVVTSRIGDAPVWREPVTGTRSWILGEATLRVPGPGKYYVVAWSASAVGGKAWVAVGTRESFTVRDLAALPRVIDGVRAFHELGPDPRLQAMARVAFLAVVSLLIAGLAWL